MSKIATLRHLPTPNDLRESVSQIQQALDSSSQRLDATAQRVQQLEQLPELIAHQVSSALRPVLTLSSDVQRVMMAYDQVTAAQREALDSLAQEMGTRTADVIQQRTMRLDQTIQQLSGQVTDMRQSLAAAEASARAHAKMPAAITAAAQEATAAITEATERSTAALDHSALELSRYSQQVRQPRWLRLGSLVAAGAVGAMLVATGQAVLERHLPLSETQEKAMVFNTLWSKATEQEKESMNKIVARPAK